MVPPAWQFVALLAVHWLGDFVLQSRWMSVNKSKRLDALSLHAVTYTATLMVGCGLVLPLHPAGLFVLFVGANGILHFATDFVTSRITSHLWCQQREHDFFVMVGLDQLIHQVTLATTLWFIFT
jgi:uncharacterized protein DUF3307